jgi:hypothetical protein
MHNANTSHYVIKMADITFDLDKGKGVMMCSLNMVMKPLTAMKQGILNHLNNI